MTITDRRSLLCSNELDQPRFCMNIFVATKVHRNGSTIGHTFRKKKVNLTIKSSRQTESFASWDADEGKVDTGDVGTGTAGGV